MDDSTRLKAEFPLGDKLKIIALEPTPAQHLVLGLTRAPKDGDGDAIMRLVRRLFGVIEALVGKDAWYDVIEDGLINGTISEMELVTFARDVMNFDWASHHKQQDRPAEDVPGEPEPVRAAPRVITGG